VVIYENAYKFSKFFIQDLKVLNGFRNNRPVFLDPEPAIQIIDKNCRL
jgi:hypothetical protein